MIFISYYNIKPENLVEAMKRFTSGDPADEMPDEVERFNGYYFRSSGRR